MGSASRDRLTDRVQAYTSTLIARARYRTWQFRRGLRAHITPDEAREIRARLNYRELALFLRMEAADRRHSMDLLHELRSDAVKHGRCPSATMAVAAIVHDVGKGRVRMWHRVAFVLLSAISLPLAHRIEAEYGAEWRQALWRLRHHAALSARLLSEAGSDPRVIEIVAAHTDPPPGVDLELTWFVAADDRV